MSDELERDDAGAADELRALYERLQPPPLADEAGESDPTTAEVVAWMRGAWQRIEPPRVAVPRPAVPLPSRRRTRSSSFALAAAAALVLLAGAAAYLRALRPASAPPPNVAEQPASGVEILAVLPDRIELRSGPVRLVLLAPTPTETTSENTDPHAGG